MGFQNFEKNVVADKILDFFDTQLFDTRLFFGHFVNFAYFFLIFPLAQFFQMQKDNRRIAQIKKLKKTNQL